METTLSLRRILGSPLRGKIDGRRHFGALCSALSGVRPGAVVLPGWAITYVAAVPGGAHPSYAHGYYDRDNDFYLRWDEISRDRDRFSAWMKRHVLETADVHEYRLSLRDETATAA